MYIVTYLAVIYNKGVILISMEVIRTQVVEYEITQTDL